MTRHTFNVDRNARFYFELSSLSRRLGYTASERSRRRQMQTVSAQASRRKRRPSLPRVSLLNKAET